MYAFYYTSLTLLIKYQVAAKVKTLLCFLQRHDCVSSCYYWIAYAMQKVFEVECQSP